MKAEGYCRSECNRMTEIKLIFKEKGPWRLKSQ